jgi:hypothetical protein
VHGARKRRGTYSTLYSVKKSVTMIGMSGGTSRDSSILGSPWHSVKNAGPIPGGSFATGSGLFSEAVPNPKLPSSPSIKGTVELLPCQSFPTLSTKEFFAHDSLQGNCKGGLGSLHWEMLILSGHVSICT